MIGLSSNRRESFALVIGSVARRLDPSHGAAAIFIVRTRDLVLCNNNFALLTGLRRFWVASPNNLLVRRLGRVVDPVRLPARLRVVDRGQARALCIQTASAALF